jgi:hypothetical protein
MSFQILAGTSDSLFHFVWWQLPVIVIIIRGVVYLAKRLPKYPPPPNLKPSAESLSPEITVPSPTATGSAQNGALVGGYACAVASLIFLPPFLGMAGIICGIVALKRGQTNQGTAVVIVSFLCALIGVFLGVMDASSPAK